MKRIKRMKLTQRMALVEYQAQLAASWIICFSMHNGYLAPWLRRLPKETGCSRRFEEVIMAAGNIVRPLARGNQLSLYVRCQLQTGSVGGRKVCVVALRHDTLHTMLGTRLVSGPFNTLAGRLDQSAVQG